MKTQPFRPLFVFAFLLLFSTTSFARQSEDSSSVAPPDTFARGKVTKIILPALFYTPETKIGGGGAAGIYWTKKPGGRTSSILAALIYTQKSQITASISPDLYLAGDRYRLSGAVAYLDFPDHFYGVGRDTPESAKEEFSARTFEAMLRFQWKLAPGLRLGPMYYLRYRDFYKVEEGRSIDLGLLTGTDAGLSSGAGFSLEWDRRDSQFFPTRGTYAILEGAVFDGAIGSDFDFTRLSADVRVYRAIARRHVLAFQGTAVVTGGTVPFHLLPGVGGQNVLRGYYEGRYRDNLMAVVQAEYRFPVWKRLGATVFGGVGNVSSRFDNFAVGDLKYAGGAGLRFRVSPEGVNLRLDYAVTPNSSGTYITIQEAF